MQAAATAAARQQESVSKHTCADSLSHLSQDADGSGTAVLEKRPERDVVVEPSSQESCSEWTAAERRRCRCLDQTRRRRVAPESCIWRYFFDEEENEPFSHDINRNAKQIVCSSRDDV